ncbi:MAG: class I tRNA ligase family protein, partial [Geminicoccaceae bacterium]|nr:class I tRNA ligase family protein [Geminicoccaceae bacterium]
ATFGESATALRTAVHKAIAGVTGDIEDFHFNRSVARIHELANVVGGFEPADDADLWAQREALESLILLVNPMMPHLAEELWSKLGHATILAESPWPVADERWLVADTVTVAVQVNGKRRGEIELGRGADNGEAEAAALELDAVKRVLDGRAPRRVIVVPDRIVNVVA